MTTDVATFCQGGSNNGDTGVTGWSVDNSRLTRHSESSAWASFGRAMALKIRGTVNDVTAPRVTSIVRHNPATSPTNADRLTWRVTFSEPVRNVDGSDFVEVSSFSGTRPRLSVSAVSTTVYDVTASGGFASANGTIRLSFLSTRNIQDLASHALTNVTPTGTAELSYTLDNTCPTVTITGVPATSSAAFTATFTFSEVGTKFTIGDIRVGNATVLNFAASRVDRRGILTPLVG